MGINGNGAMRIWAVSDVHLDYEVNLDWLRALSRQEHRHDLLILAGDISDSVELIELCFAELAARFAKVFYVPGNHDLWVARRPGAATSLERFAELLELADAHGVITRPHRHGELAIMPLFGWYDYSFGPPSEDLLAAWVDYRACRWPAGYDEQAVTRHFLALNPTAQDPALAGAGRVISFSHFVPRLDVMPWGIRGRGRMVFPVLGTSLLDRQLRALGSSLHVYGHSHVNRALTLDGVAYVNNALGYPSEAHFTARQLRCVLDE